VKKDSVVLHLCNVLEVALFNINQGFNQSRETVVRHCIDFLKHTKKSPIIKQEILEFERLLNEVKIVKN
jgi:hypothetical protein